MESSRQKYIDIAYVILRDVLKNWIAIISIALSASLFAYIFVCVSYVPKYTSRCTMIVSAKVNNSGAYTDANETEKLTNTIKAVMDSTIIKQKTAEAVGMDSFNGTVNVYVIPKTNMLEISVTTTNPNTSFRYLNALLDTYPEISKDVLGEIVMEVFEEPSFPSSPDNSIQYKKVTRNVFLIAAGIVILLLGVYSYFLETVKNKWDAEEKLDTKLLGVLYHESAYRNVKAMLKREKKRILMGAPSISFSFSETVKKIRTNLGFYQEKTGGKVLLVTSYDKKEGKTTVAANLAVSFAQRNQKVLLVPGTASYTPLLDILKITLPDELTEEPKDKLSDMVYTKEGSELSVLVNTRGTNAGSFSAEVLSDDFREFLETAKDEYDYIIIDGPSVKLSGDVESLAKLSDFSVLVVRQNYTMGIFV